MTNVPAAATGKTLVGHVDVLDVEAEHLVRPGGGLVEQPPEAALAQADALKLVRDAEATTGNEVEAALGDAAYGSTKTRRGFVGPSAR